ncbi:MAG: ATP-binding protein [Pseudomonadota bacterium]|nr:ATP-binding protein [Pseudomonadota bacterium]
MYAEISIRPLTHRIALGLGMIVLVSASAYFARPAIGTIASTLSLVIGVLLVGASQGLVPGLIAATVGFLFYNFFMADPILTLRLANGEDLAPLIAFNLTALIAGVLAGKLRDRAGAAERATAWSKLLIEAGNEVQALISPVEVNERLREMASRRFGLTVEFSLPDSTGDLSPTTSHEALTAWATRGAKRSGPSISLIMEGVAGPMGVLTAAGDWRRFDDFLPSFATLAAVALERSILWARVGEVRALEQSEQIKSALLSSVSHDFRTPLAAISASASSLIEFEHQINADQKSLFLRTILSECTRLDNYASNLLELSKLEGNEALRVQVLVVNDVVGSVLSLSYIRNADRKIHVSVPDDVLVKTNTTLFELTLLNILGNAINFSDPGSRIEIEGRNGQGILELRIRDEGHGLASAELPRIFEKFYRGTQAHRSSTGSGLGLAIAKGFVAASGGSIDASLPGIGDRGLTITMRLPAVPADIEFV